MAAAALDRAGHTVTVAVPANLVPMVARTGLATRELCPDTDALLAGPVVRQRLRSRNPAVRFRALREVGDHGADESERVMADLADDADMLVTGLLAQERAATIAESRRIGFRPLHYCPIRPNRVVRPSGLPVPAGLTPALWHGIDRAYWWSVRDRDRRLRRSLGLPPVDEPLGGRLRRRGDMELQVYDAAFFPGLDAEWGAQRPCVGFLTPDSPLAAALNGTARDSESDGTDDVLAWAHARRPPVYVGFGSMPVERVVLQGIVDTLVAQGHRVIAHTTRPLRPSTAVYRVGGAVNHARLLPACAAAVHHGGAGTTAAAARAGVPMVIGWLSADQPIWGRAVANHGAGHGVRLSRLTGADLAVIGDPDASRAARALSARLVAPDRAVEAVTHTLLACHEVPA